jgi:MFS family permease
MLEPSKEPVSGGPAGVSPATRDRDRGIGGQSADRRPMPREASPRITTHRAWPLYGAALMMAISLSVAWTAMPFVLTAMGGTHAHVGYAPAANTFAYTLALLIAGSWFSHLRVRRTTLTAGTVALAATAAMSLCVLWTHTHGGAGGRFWIWALIVSGGVGGAAMALYWPFLMSWVSADYEGVRLNRRFGRYNGAWSGGAAIGPLIGGWLFEVNALLPLAVAVLFVLLAQLLLRFGQDGPAERSAPPGASKEVGRGKSEGAGSTSVLPTAQPTPASVAAGPLGYDMRLLADCRWMSRVGLFSACACFAMVRSQFALVFTGFGYAESQFGLYLTIYALCNFAALVAAGRWAFWHFRPGLLLVAEAALLLMLGMTIYGTTLGVFLLASVLLGFAYGFAYSSHLYYGASASRRRSARMAIHEITISIGLTTGSFAGGYFAEHVSLYAPYWFAVTAVGLGLAVQTLLYLAARARMAHDRKMSALTGTEIAQ